MQRACYFIAPQGTDLSALSAVVTGAGWHVLNPESVELGSSTYLELTIHMIEAADAVIVVLTDRDNSTALFEAGLALGQDRPLLLVADDEAIMDDQSPDRILAGLPRVRATPSERGALLLHVTAFLDSIETQTRRKPDVGNPLPRTGFGKEVAIENHAPRPATALERQVLAMFELSLEVEAVLREPGVGRDRAFVPDFAVWFGKGQRFVPNPLIVELVGGSHLDRSIADKLDQLRRYAAESGIAAVMLIHGVSAAPLSLARLGPMTFTVGLEELEELLRRGTLLETMLRQRNEYVHSAVR